MQDARLYCNNIVQNRIQKFYEKTQQYQNNCLKEYLCLDDLMQFLVHFVRMLTLVGEID